MYFVSPLCVYLYEIGYCRYGMKCRFAHGGVDLRSVNRHKKYKTEKCKNYTMTGHCPYGTRCKFLHEDTEIIMNPVFQQTVQQALPHLNNIAALTALGLDLNQAATVAAAAANATVNNNNNNVNNVNNQQDSINQDDHDNQLMDAALLEQVCVSLSVIDINILHCYVHNM